MTPGKRRASRRELATPDLLDLAAVITLDWQAAAGEVRVGGCGPAVLGFVRGTLDDLLVRVHPGDRDSFLRTLETTAEEGSDQPVELRWPRESEAPLILAGRLRRVDGNDRARARVAGALRDVSESRARERALADRGRLLSSLFQRAPVGMGVSDEQGRLVLFNEAIATLGGYTRQEVEALGSVAELYWDAAERDTILARVREEGHVDGAEVRFRRRDGSPFLGALSIVPLEVDGRILLLATVEDVTDSRALEDQLLRSQKLEAVGRLAGGIAHDFNNLVTVILGYASFLEESMESDDPMLTSIEQIASAGHRAAELTRQLLAFARRQMVQPRLLVLTDVILGLDGMLRRLLGEHVELDTRVAPELWPVSIDPGQLEQVIVNLAVNARDAMPGGGRLTMETGNVEVGADQPYNPAMVPGSYVRLAITDTGEGMSPTTQMRLFEPFFSTKELGKGTGLGLATCYGIVKQASGYIWVDSEPERGTTFEIYLPRAEGAVERRGGEPRERAEVPGGSEHILLVEDDPQVNEIAVETLRSRGYVVHTALTGEEAIEVASQLDRLDLLVTDIVLPKLGGDEVASRMAGSRPGLPVIYMSGYTDSVAVRRVLSAGGSFLQKPFTPERLAMEVRAALDRRR